MVDDLGNDKLWPDIESAKVFLDSDIEEYVTNDRLIDKNLFDHDSLQGCSYDLRVGTQAVVGGTGTPIDLSESALELEPGSYAGIISLEKIALPKNVFIRLGAKRKFSYDGLILLTGQIVDPGYSGHLVFGIYNASPKKRFIRRGDKICNAVFMLLGKEPKRILSEDQNLSKGKFPPEFLKSLDELDVVPYAELSKKMGQLNKIQDDIGKLQEKLNDIFSPIRDLKTTVERLTADVKSNADQVSQLTGDVTALTESVKTVHSRQGEALDRFGSYEQDMGSQKVNTKILMWSVGAIWSIALIIIACFITYFVTTGMSNK